MSKIEILDACYTIPDRLLVTLKYYKTYNHRMSERQILKKTKHFFKNVHIFFTYFWTPFHQNNFDEFLNNFDDKIGLWRVYVTIIYYVKNFLVQFIPTCFPHCIAIHCFDTATLAWRIHFKGPLRYQLQQHCNRGTGNTHVNYIVDSEILKNT